MKRFPFLTLALILTVFLCRSGVSTNHQALDPHAAIISSDAASLSLEFSLSNLETEPVSVNGETCAAIRMTDEGTTYQFGKPLLPLVSRFVVVPPGAGLELEVSVGEQRRIRADSPPQTCLEENLRSEGDDIGVENLYPPVVAEMSKPMQIRGVRVVKITTYPVQWDPLRDEYIYNERIQATIRFTDSEPVNPVEYPVRRHRSRDFMKFMRGFAINGDIVGRDDPDADAEPSYYGHYLVVSHQNCLQYAAQWIEWRRKSGYKVDILVPENPNNPNGTRDEIRERYQEYLENGEDPFDYILLIGDLSSYDNCGAGPQWILESFQSRSAWNNNINHADYLYACMDGDDDEYPDVGISRWASGSQDQMGLAVGRTMLYEANPNIDDPDWFERAALYSQHYGNSEASEWHVTLHTNARWGDEVLQNCGYDDIQFYEEYAWDQRGQRIGPWLRDNFNEGASIFIGRSENYYWQNNFNGVNVNTRFPMIINLSNTSNWPSWWMWRGGASDQLKGPVSCTFGWGQMPIALCSAAWMETVKNVMLQDIPLGWGYCGAIIAVERYFPNTAWLGRTDFYTTIKTDYNCYGDPGLLPWKGTPRVVNVSIPDQMTPGTRLIEAQVTDAEDNNVSGARVTFYAPGDMPDFDDNDYRNYDGMYAQTHLSAENGQVRFVLDNEVELGGNRVYLTVTGSDIVPVHGEIRIVGNLAKIELEEYEIEEIAGNGDEEINPGESCRINLTAVNSDRDEGFNDVTAVVTSNSPWIEVADNEIQFGNIAAGESINGDEGVEIQVHPSCPDGISNPQNQPELNIEFQSGDQIFTSALKLVPHSPDFHVRGIVGGDLIGVDEQELDIELINVGSVRSSVMNATIVPLDNGVAVLNGEADYPQINPGEAAVIRGEPFQVAGTNFVIPGSWHNVMLILESADDFLDTVYFDLQVEEPREFAPQGPDAFGYMCFDDTDEDWEVAPMYEWIEINPEDREADYEGQACDFDGRSEYDVGESQVVELGMTTQFYGQLYDRITICTNGFICPGDQGQITNFQNWPLERGMGGGVGMIAPFWDWLDYNNNSRVLFFHDEDRGRFIIQWYRMRHHSGANADLTFQVILYDHEIWMTESGDQNILFQYRSISNVRGQVEGIERERNNPFASTGISSPLGDAGLGYTWNNEYPDNCAPLENRRAILYTTSLNSRRNIGTIEGVVLDFETDRPIEGAHVRAGFGSVAATDENGFYRINNVLTDFPMPIMATADGYNDSTLFDMEVAEDETLHVDFNLLHPEFEPSLDAINAELRENEERDFNFEVSNPGNGPLEYFTELRLRGDANVDPWDLRRQYMVGEITQDSRIQGAVFANDRFYLAGANNGNPLIYVLNREGDILDRFNQPEDVGNYGMRDLAWDGELIWGSGAATVYGLSTEGDVAVEFQGPFNPNTNITWDSDRELLWISTTTGDINGYNRAGEHIDRLSRDDLRVYGLAYWANDPDGYPLYIYCRQPDLGDQCLYKMNPDNNDTMFVRVLEPDDGGIAAGVEITDQLDVYSWVLLSIINNGADDRVDVWQLEAQRGWIDLEPSQGMIDAGEAQEFTIHFDADNLPAGVVFSADYHFFHNAVEGEFVLPVNLTILDDQLRMMRIQLNAGWNIISLNVQPDNVDIRQLMQPLTDLNQLMLMKDGLGRFYLPERDFNNIPQWSVDEGYQILLTENTALEVTGEPIAPDADIPLGEGWNFIAYYPNYVLDASAPDFYALSPIIDNVVLAKDGVGHFLSTEFNFSNMPPWRESLGYQVRVDEDVVLNYPPEPEEDVIARYEAIKQPERLIHFVRNDVTSSNMSVMVTNLPEDGEIGAFSASGICVGATAFRNPDQVGLAVWGDDESTVEVDGLKEGEAFTLKFWSPDLNTEFDLKTSTLSNFVFETNGFTVIDAEIQPAIPDQYFLSQNYPNPFNSSTRYKYGLPEKSNLSIRVFDISGRMVTRLVEGEVEAGYHTAIWDASTVSTGVYLMKMETASFSFVRKVILVR